jgi:hypothetical protein
MPKVKTVEKQIWDLEGFDAQFHYERGRDVRDDRPLSASYNGYRRQAKNDMTVAEWREGRFRKTFPGFDVAVLNGDGEPVPGNTKLGTVRYSYSDDEDE